MKKLFFFLFPFFIYAQDLKLDHSYINSPNFNVGDTITIKFNTLDNNSSTANLYMFDYEYNNKLLQKVTHRFKVTGNQTNTNAQTSVSHWDGWKFNIDESKDEYNLYDQYLWWASGTEDSDGVASYYQTNDWSVERITIQDANKIEFNNTLLEVDFIIKDKQNTNYTNYNNVTHLNWMRAYDNSTSTEFETHSMTQKVSLSDVKGGDAGSVTINLKTANNKPTNYKYTIKQNTSEKASGYFDDNSQAIITGLENDIEYNIEIAVDTTLTDWLDDVVTVTDVFLVFKEAIGAGSNPNGTTGTFSYPIQYLLGEVNNSGNVDFEDSYILLNHITNNSTSEWFTNSTNGAKDVYGDTDYYGVSSDEYYFGQKKTFKPTDSNKIFNIGHGLIGDVDFSHSYTPTAGQETATIREGAAIAANAENLDLDITTELVNENVEMLVNLEKEDLAGMQFVVKYDPNIIEFKEIIFDTGNNLTNFVTTRNQKIYFGTISIENNENIKTGKPFKIIFNSLQNITNTSGLIYFETTDAVTKEGKKIILNIK